MQYYHSFCFTFQPWCVNIPEWQIFVDFVDNGFSERMMIFENRFLRIFKWFLTILQEGEGKNNLDFQGFSAGWRISGIYGMNKIDWNNWTKLSDLSLGIFIVSFDFIWAFPKILYNLEDFSLIWQRIFYEYLPLEHPSCYSPTATICLSNNVHKTYE